MVETIRFRKAKQSYVFIYVLVRLVFTHLLGKVIFLRAFRFVLWLGRGGMCVRAYIATLLSFIRSTLSCVVWEGRVGVCVCGAISG